MFNNHINIESVNVESVNVVNVKVKYIRPTHDNLREWTLDPNNVYIGRKGVVFIDGIRFPPNNSIWCNPFKIGKHGSRDDVLVLYEEYITEKINEDSELLDELRNLNGKNLGCWCAPEPCHGDILKEIIQRYS
jgi:hypothetical protein